MKKTSRLISMLIVFAMVVANIAPFKAVTTYASGLELSYTSIRQDGTLDIGDTFDIRLTVHGEGIIEEGEDESNFTVDLSGAATSHDRNSMDVTSSNGRATIEVKDAKYNGNGEEVGIVVYHRPSSKESNMVIETLDVKETVEAGEALELTTNTINVVAGETQRITLTFRNNSNSTSNAAEIKLAIPSSTKGIKLRSNSFEVPILKRGESKEFQVTIDVEEDVPQGLYDMEVEINGMTQIVKLRVDSTFMPPSLEITASNTDGFGPNQAQDLEINLKNVGHSNARNVKIEIVQDSNIFVMDGSNVRYIESIDAGETESLTVKLQVGSSELSTVPVQLKVTYIDNEGEQREDTQYIYLNTVGGSLTEGVVIENIIAPGGVYKPGQPFVVKFTVSAPSDIENVQIRVEGSESIVPTERNLFIIDSMKAGEKQQFTTTFMPTPSASSETHLLSINVSYPLNSNLSEHSQFTTVQVNNPDGEDGETLKGQPKVIIGQYQSEPVVVQAGETFDLSIGFLNTHSEQTVYNLKANITVKEQGENNTGSVFTPVGASNTFYIAEMAPGQIINKDITMYTIPTATPKTYEVVFEMEYEDADGTQIMATEYIGIPVEQVTELEVVEIVTEMVEVGRDSNLRAQIFNKGKTDISNVIISTEGEGFTVEDNKMTEGLFERGDILYYEPILYPYEEGLLQGKVIIEYEDVNGQVHTMEEPFEVEVFPAYVPEVIPGDGEDWGMDIMVPDMEENKPSRLPSILGVVLGMGIAAGITAIVLKKRQDRIDEFDYDED